MFRIRWSDDLGDVLDFSYVTKNENVKSTHTRTRDQWLPIIKSSNAFRDVVKHSRFWIILIRIESYNGHVTKRIMLRHIFNEKYRVNDNFKCGSTIGKVAKSI